MFKDIRKRITLFNTLILIAFFIIFLAVLVLLIQWSLGASGKIYLKSVAAELTDSQVPEEAALVDTRFHENIGYEYILWNGDGSVKAQKAAQGALVSAAHTLLEQETAEESFSVLRAGGIDYRVYTKHLKENGKPVTLQVFQQKMTEGSIIAYLITYLLLIGGAGILCLIPISYVLAGRSLRPVKKSFDDQKQFVANASHELRTPLTVIQTNLEVLDMKEDETIAENVRWLNNIRIECDNMSTLISEMLLIAQADHKKLTYNDKNFSLSALVAEVCMLMSAGAMEKQIVLTSDIDPDITFVGDEDKLRQMVRIFLDNAIKYTPAEGQVEVTLSQNKRGVTLEFKDTGQGITEEDQERIFERFYRCDADRNRKTGGSGLGLNIAQMLIHHYGGSVKVDSCVGLGTRFTVFLPKKVSASV